MKFKNKKNWYIFFLYLSFSNYFIFADLQFDSEGSSFILKNSSSKIRLNPSTIYGWRDSSIVNKVSGIGLGDYNLKQYDFNLDTIITYTDVCNSMQYINWTIPANTTVHIKENILMDGYGGTINIGENSQLFVDDNVTLTLRNVFISGSKNGVGNPFIKLASHRSKLALDYATLNLANDFYFDRGQLFFYNDVNFCGTNAFVFRSTLPSYITSEACLKFNPNTTFYFTPSNVKTPNPLAQNLLVMQDITSRLYLDGCTLKTTMTGMRLTKGQLIFDNKVTISSAYQLNLKSTGSWNYIGNDDSVSSVKFSPDGRYVAAGYAYATSGYDIFVYDLSLNVVDFHNFGGTVHSIDWSPDGRYLAIGGATNSSGDELQIYKFDGSLLTLVLSQSYGHEYSPTVYSVNWSPDGRFLAIGGQYPTSEKELQIYRFDGISLSLVASQDSQFDFGSIDSAIWSPDGKYIAVGEYYVTGSTKLRIYNFDGSSLSLTAETGSFYEISSISWSPDGFYLAVGVDGYIQIYYFDGSVLSFAVSEPYGNNVNSVYWSPDGRYIAIGGAFPDTGHSQLEIYSFDSWNWILNLIAYQSYGTGEYGSLASVNWSPDGKFLSTGGSTILSEHGGVEIYTLQYDPETNAQSVSNSIVFGNSALGPSYDLNINMLAGTNVEVDGIINYDNVN